MLLQVKANVVATYKTATLHSALIKVNTGRHDLGPFNILNKVHVQTGNRLCNELDSTTLYHECFTIFLGTSSEDYRVYGFNNCDELCDL